MLKLLSIFPKSLTKRLIQGVCLVRSPFTLGVRVIVEDTAGSVLLVRHSYFAGWYLPGGGVDGGEFAADAARREVHEEAGVRATAEPRLLGVYLNLEAWGRDHVVLYHMTDWEEGGTFLESSAEIVEARFFPLTALPGDLSGATRRRLTEFAEGRVTGSGTW